jgi:hypothetical protein
MKKQDLRNGDIILTRENRKAIVMDITTYQNENIEKVLVYLENGGYEPLSNYNDDLTFIEMEHIDNIRYDIVKVCQMSNGVENFRHHIAIDKSGITESIGNNWTWVREKKRSIYSCKP